MGRKLPTEQDSTPKVYALRLFARNAVIAKSKFWYHLRRLLKTKSAAGQILSVSILDNVKGLEYLELGMFGCMKNTHTTY